MAAQQITQGAISAIVEDYSNARTRFPVPILQCLQIKTLDTKAGGAGDRYRIVLSDMVNYVQCILATQANHVVHDGLLQRGSIVRLKEYNPQLHKGKSLIVVLDLDVITNLGNPEKLGDPVSLEQKGQQPQPTETGSTGFYGGPVKTESPYDIKPPVRKAPAQQSRPPAGSGHASTIYPIESLSPYAHKWTIKARVTSKTPIKTWHKPSGEGKLFSVNLLDETGEIRATGFQEAVDNFYDLLQENSVYYISSPCRVQMAKKQFSNLSNEYELTFQNETVIEKAEDQSSVPQVRFNFVTIQELQEVEKDATVDVIGVLKEVQDVSQIISKSTQKPYDKRELTLVDDTNYSVRVTVWGKTATEFDAAPESVIAFKGTRVSDFGGRSLSLLSSGTMAIEPDIPECHRLKGWYDGSGRNNAFASHAGLSTGAATGRKDETKTIAEVKSQMIGAEEAAYFSLKATITFIKKDSTFSYPACRSEGCNKKVTDMGDGTWRCEKCDVSHDRPEHRYIMSLGVNDHTGQTYLNCFDDTARIIMGMSADELIELRDTDERAFGAAFEQAMCKTYSFRCRAKMDTYNDTSRMRYQVMSAVPINYKEEGAKLARLIEQLSM